MHADVRMTTRSETVGGTASRPRGTRGMISGGVSVFRGHLPNHADQRVMVKILFE